ncbi:MAG: orotidine-5'-phosphate decarboxylase [Rhodospirillales bacterium]|nr:orotidine-5'-phosphate decarboxylase [Rhodospirillales bacterium]
MLNSGLLSTKPIPADERLILALDVPSPQTAWQLVERLGPRVRFYKLGLELFMAGGYFELITALRQRGNRVFVDLKFFDVPQTVRSAVRQLACRGADFATVHGNDAILEAACAVKEDLRILAVTVLTSLDDADMQALGFQTDIRSLVLSRAQRALAIGCDGVVSSGLEATRLRQELGDRLLIVVPGIRPALNRPTDDQKRTMDVEEAFLAGADHIVVGRPIHGAADPCAAAEDIQARIAAVFSA